MKVIMEKCQKIINIFAGEDSPMRECTPEEQQALDRYISSISEPTGVSIWDLVDNEEK